MDEFTNENFQTLKKRYYDYLIYFYQKILKESRDPEFAKTIQIALHECINGNTFDEFSQEVAMNFSIQYKMGVGIPTIMKGLREAQVHFLSANDPSNDITFKDEYIKIFGIKTNHIKSTTYYDKNGNEKSKFEYDYNYSFKNLRKFIGAKTEQEKLDVFYNEIQTSEQTVVSEVQLTTQIIDVNEQNDRKWFKALVRYQTRQEFAEFLEKNNSEETDVKIKKKIADPEKIKKLVKWTNGKNNNDFVKLVYTLFEAKLINNGKGEITKIVENMAQVFDIELKDWQSNFSKSIHEQNLGYDHGAFFEKLKNTYVDYQKEKEKNKK